MIEDDDFAIGMIFDADYTSRLMRLSAYYDMSPHGVMRLAINKMVEVLDRVEEDEEENG